MSTERVIRLRVETFTSQGWGVNELARATGIAPITISKLFRRQEAPSRIAMERFASTFPDMEPADLIEFVSVAHSAAPVRVLKVGMPDPRHAIGVTDNAGIEHTVKIEAKKVKKAAKLARKQAKA